MHARVASPEAHDLPVKTEYVCPMHPEVVRGPDELPLCGMALEPRTVTLDDAPSPELVDMTRRFRSRARSRCLVLLLAMSDVDPRQPLERVARRGAHRLAPARARDAGGARGADGRSSSARLALARQPQPQHVHADRARHRRRVRLQRRRDDRSRASSPLRSAARRQRARVLRGGRRHHGARAARAGARAARAAPAPRTRSARCSARAEDRAASSAPTAREEDVPLEQVQVGDRLRVRPGEKRAGRRRRARGRERRSTSR